MTRCWWEWSAQTTGQSGPPLPPAPRPALSLGARRPREGGSFRMSSHRLSLSLFGFSRSAKHSQQSGAWVRATASHTVFFINMHMYVHTDTHTQTHIPTPTHTPSHIYTPHPYTHTHTHTHRHTYQHQHT